ncbi:DUF2207 domain-containing protein [Georgenia alba]|uniref:DUF2207 domain-containing protein n=1 Tax=Georgenia alba TaxID=2233858 RepID=A0ABW2Q7H8_9MICO
MRAPRRAAALLTLLVGGLMVSTPAQADEEDEAGTITRMDITADLAADRGTARIVVDLELDLGSDEAHGPYLALAEQQEIAGDPDHYRVLDVTGITASSETAPDDLRVEREDGAVQLYVGDEDTEITGRHEYRIEYTATGLVNPDVAGTDELYWNAVAPGGFEIPIEDVTVTVNGPAAATGGACYVGRTGSEEECGDLGLSGGTVRARQGALEPETGLSVVVGWPAGTFQDAEPVLTHRYTPANVIQLTPLTGGVTALAVLAGTGAVALHARRRGRDQAYLGLTPGLTPAPGQSAQTGTARRAPVAVRFTPPDGVRPGEVGTLADEVAHGHDVTATIIDLAVRGYLRIEEVAPEAEDGAGAESTDDGEDAAPDPEDWRLVRLRSDSDGLERYEAALLGRIFAEGEEVTLSDLGTDLQTTVSATQNDLYETVTERGWFAGNPQKIRNRWIVRGIVVLGVGVLAIPVLWVTQLPLVLVLIPLLLGVALLVASTAMPVRTADGTAVLAQALGFRQYLETAEAEQIRFEEREGGTDVFSRYLPYAIVFELADRWAEIVAEAARVQGHPMPEPTWYVPIVHMSLWSDPGRFSSNVGSFATAASTAVTAGSTGAGGSSGFTGSVGGGVGGMGGGTW